MFAEPARAISRNAIVISVGFLPLLASPLVPYNTVGFFLATIMVVSSFVTLMLLPSVMNHLKNRIFRGHLPHSQESELATDAGRQRLSGKTAIVAIVFGAIALPAAAQDMTAVDAIITRANNVAYYAGEDGRSRVRMTITDKKGRQRKRQFTILRKDQTDGGDQDYAVLFERPADVRGTVFLVKKHVAKDDDRWLYLPDLDLVKRIAAGDKRTSFVGSHFFYEDVSGRRIDADKHELVETTDEHYVLKNTPLPGKKVEFTHWIAWIDKKTFIPVRMDYMDGEEVYRRIEALDVQDVGGHPTVVRMKVSDLRAGGFTVSEFRNVEYDIGVPDDVFTERTLRNPPRQWFKGK
jgi:outer membrane lipoprotein-sorting protein